MSTLATPLIVQAQSALDRAAAAPREQQRRLLARDAALIRQTIALLDRVGFACKEQGRGRALEYVMFIRQSMLQQVASILATRSSLPTSRVAVLATGRCDS